MMIEPSEFGSLVIRPALQGLNLWSLAAERLLLGTAIAESGLRHLKQTRGPALGLYQVEPATHDDLYENWLHFRPDWGNRLIECTTDYGTYTEQLVWNLAYATAVARLIYYRRPEPLPDTGDLRGQAEYWKAHYNTEAGKGTVEYYISKVRKHWHGPAFLDDATNP